MAYCALHKGHFSDTAGCPYCSPEEDGEGEHFIGSEEMNKSSVQSQLNQAIAHIEEIKRDHAAREAKWANQFRRMENRWSKAVIARDEADAKWGKEVMLHAVTMFELKEALALVDNTAMLVRRLCARMEDCPIRRQAFDYLKLKGLEGSAIR